MATCIADVLQCLLQATNVWRAPDRSPDGREEEAFIKGSVVLIKKNVLDFTDFTASVLDRVYELLGNKLSFQLVSATVGDPM